VVSRWNELGSTSFWIDWTGPEVSEAPAFSHRKATEGKFPSEVSVAEVERTFREVLSTARKALDKAAR